MQGKTMQEEVNSILASMDTTGEQDDQEQTSPPESTEPIEDIYVYIVRDHEEEPDQPADDDVIETTLAQQKPSILALFPFFFALMLTGSSIAFQLYLALHPFTATVTIVPKSQQVTLSGTLQLGRLLHPITLSESQTVPTTGTGHQDARSATGYITFYNGSFSEQIVSAGTILTGADGVQVVTDQQAFIPAESQTIPPALGNVTVSAHALIPGVRGNIRAGDINQHCCFASLLVQNTRGFYGGQDERDFQTVAKTDIAHAATPLKTILSASIKGAFQGQLKEGEALITLPCSPTISPDHQPGDESTQVTISVSEACSAAACNTGQLQRKALLFLTSQERRTLGAGYSEVGNLHVTVNQATIRGTTPTLVFSSVSTWVYALTAMDQEHIKALIAGKTKQEAMRLLSSLPGIEQVAIAWRDDTKLPKDTQYIHLILLIQSR
jgi:hypothetical protein